MQEATLRRVTPSIPADDPRFKWTRGADVQATWRRFGWTPPSEGRTPAAEPSFAPELLRRAA